MQSINPTQSYAVDGDPFLELCVTYDGATPEEAMINACGMLIYKSGSSGFSSHFKDLLTACNARVIEKDIATPGRLEIEENGYAIYISNQIPESRKRFSIAHEIAHILIIEGLYHKPQLLRSLRSHVNWEKVERLCDLAASEILIPPNHFIEQIKKLGLTSDGIQKVCEYYGISRDSFFVKFTNVFKPSAIALCKSQTNSNHFTPSIVSIRGSLLPLPVKKGPLKMTNIMQNLIRATVLNGQAWSNSLVVKVKGKNTKIFRLALLTSNSVHYKKKNLTTLDGIDIIERDYGNYDIMLFYLPLNLIPNSDDLIVAMR